METSDLLHSTDELRKLIIENPGLPLLVMAYEDAADTICSRVDAEVGEFLDCEQFIEKEKCYIDRDDLWNDFWEYYENDYDGNDYVKFIDDKMSEYEPYWKKCIIIYVGN